MKETVTIKMDLLQPCFILDLESKHKEIIWSTFLQMVEDIKTSNFSINILGKDYNIDTKLEISKKDNTINNFRYYKTIIFSFSIDINEAFFGIEAYKTNGNETISLNKEELLRCNKKCLETEIEKYIMDLVFAMNLAYPGLFEISNSKTYFNKEEITNLRKEAILIDWLDVYINYLENNWPKINIIKFEKVWKWLNAKTNFKNGISKTAIDRALNALTYAMADASYEKIFYILMGIEAIYNDNKNNGIAEQIRVKTESLLKRPEVYKKKYFQNL